MTLRRQLFAALSALFLVVLVGLLLLNVRGTRDYLQSQLASHAQDAATSLSLPLAQAMQRGDPVLTQMQVESVFDRGFFQRIVVVDPRGEVLVSKELPDKVADVPLWFSRWFALNPPGGEAFISSGWKQLGKVVVVSQPAHAYQYLWSTASEVAAWVGLVYLLALLATHGLLRYVLRPLYAIELTAKAIQEKRFEQIAFVPRARELARVVRAMNNMSRRIAEILNEEVARADALRKQVLQDSVTGLDNRQSFDLRLHALLEGRDTTPHGLVLGLEVNGLKDFNTGSSYQKGNALLQAVAARAHGVLGETVRIGARLGGASFGFVLADATLEQGRHLVQLLQLALQEEFVLQDPQGGVTFSLGAVYFAEARKKGELMARLDMAIEMARQSGRNAEHVLSDELTGQDTLGSLGWRDLIENALQQGRWSLYGQPVVGFANGDTVHLEVMGRLVDQAGQLVQASSFIPMAMRHKLMPAVDRAIVSLAKAHLLTVPGGAALAINVSVQSLAHRPFLDWLKGQLDELGGLAKRLSFEVTGYGCSQDLKAALAFAAMVRKAGAKFGLDRLGLDPISAKVLRELPPDYVKLDSTLVLQALDEQGAKAWVQSMVVLARSLDAVVIAQGVETPEQAAQLRTTHDAAQGFLLGAPKPLN